MKKDRLSAYNPAVGFVFFMGAIILGMFFIHPLFLCAAMLLSTACCLSLKGAEGFKADRRAAVCSGRGIHHKPAVQYAR